jgi:hypothetical protein
MAFFVHQRDQLLFPSYSIYFLEKGEKTKKNTENIISQSVYPIMDEQLKFIPITSSGFLN